MGAELDTSGQLDQARFEQVNIFLAELQADRDRLSSGRSLEESSEDFFAHAARELSTLGYFPSIPTEDPYSPDADVDDEARQLGLPVHVETDEMHGYTRGAVLLYPDGALWVGHASDDFGEGFEFDFEAAGQVPPEEYSRYLPEAIHAMIFIVEEKSGIAAMRAQEKEDKRDSISKLHADLLKVADKAEAIMWPESPLSVGELNEFSVNPNNWGAIRRKVINNPNSLYRNQEPDLSAEEEIARHIAQDRTNRANEKANPSSAVITESSEFI